MTTPETTPLSKVEINSRIRNHWGYLILFAEVSTQTKMVACAIEIRLNHKTLTCYPSYKQLMLDVGVTRTTLMKSLNKLEALGLITRTPRKATSNIYSIVAAQVIDYISTHHKEYVVEVGAGINEVSTLPKQTHSVKGAGINEVSTLPKQTHSVKGVGINEALGVGINEVPGTLTSNLHPSTTPISNSKEIYTGVKINQSKKRPKLDKTEDDEVCVSEYHLSEEHINDPRWAMHEEVEGGAVEGVKSEAIIPYYGVELLDLVHSNLKKKMEVEV